MKARKEVPHLVISANAGGMLIDLPDSAVSVSVYDMSSPDPIKSFILDEESRSLRIDGQVDYRIVWVDKDGVSNTSILRARFLLGKTYIDLNDIINTDDETWADIVKNRDWFKSQGVLSEIKYFKASDSYRWVCLDDLVNGSAEKFKNFINEVKLMRLKKPIKRDKNESTGDTTVNN